MFFTRPIDEYFTRDRLTNFEALFVEPSYEFREWLFSWNRVINFEILTDKRLQNFVFSCNQLNNFMAFFMRSIDKVWNMFTWPIVEFYVIFYATKWRKLLFFSSQPINKYRDISLVDWWISHFYPTTATDDQIPVFSHVWLKSFAISTCDWHEFRAIFLRRIDEYRATGRGIAWFFPTND